MNFNVYIDETTVERLNTLARETGTTRNALIREAVAHHLDRRALPGWPEEVMKFQGEPSAPAFELTRGGLRSPKKDPFR